MTSEYPMACIASASIAEGNACIFLMYRDEPEQGQPDSGWRFFDGTEENYNVNFDNMCIIRLSDIVEANPEIKNLINSDTETIYCRNEDGRLIKIPDFGTEGLASNIITDYGHKVKYICRTQPMKASPDCGWRFFSGTEGTFVNNPNNSKIVRVIDIIADNPKLLPLLNSEIGTAYRMNDCKEFEKVM